MNLANLEDTVRELVFKANFVLREDVSRLFSQALSGAASKKTKQALRWIIENAALAGKNRLAICQDTGFPVIFVEIGKNKAFSGETVEAIRRSLVKAYKDFCLRPSLTDPFSRAGSYYGLGEYYVEYNRKIKGIRISLLVKGFGCENKTSLKMFRPTVSDNEVEDFIVDSVSKAGPEACPPFFIGVGIGGASEGALLLAKKALLGRLDKKNTDESLVRMENRLFKKINALGIGPMGFGKGPTAFAVKVKKAYTHIAGMPVGVSINCHALRSASVTL